VNPTKPELTDLFIDQLVLKCVCEETGEEPDDVLAAKQLEVCDRDYLGIIHRIESFFDCTLDLHAAPKRTLVLADLRERVRHACGRV
jgi:uncharacterized protein DUF6137